MSYMLLPIPDHSSRSSLQAQADRLCSLVQGVEVMPALTQEVTAS